MTTDTKEPMGECCPDCYSDEGDCTGACNCHRNAAKAQKSKNVELLADFTNFCLKNPQLRFWQALRAWAGQDFILFADIGEGNGYEGFKDTFHFENKTS